MSTLVLACGALAREILALLPPERFPAIHLHCLPATLHNRPERIAPAVRAALAEAAGRYDRVFVAYADCGTGGALDAVLVETGAERLPGAHCYAFFTGVARLRPHRRGRPAQLLPHRFPGSAFRDAGVGGPRPGSPSGAARRLFREVRRVVYLAQTEDAALTAAARAAAGRLGLGFRAALRRLRRPRPGDGAAGGGVRALSVSFLPI